EQPFRHPQEAVLRRTVQHRHAVWWAHAGKSGLGLEHGDHRLLAAGHHGVAETTHAIALRVDAARAALLFLRGHQCDDLAVPAFLGDRARAGRVSVGPDAVARVRSRFEQQSRHLDVTRHDRDMDGAYFEARRSLAQEIHDLCPPREQLTNRAEVAFLHGLVQPLRRDTLDGGFQLRPALEPVRARPHELRVVQGEGFRRGGAMVSTDLGDGVWRLRAIRLQQLPGLSPQLIDVGILAHRARRRVRNAAKAFRETGRPANGHDELLSRPCLRHSPARPLSAARAGKEIILTTTRPMSGWTQSFPRTWVTPRCASASIPRRSTGSRSPDSASFTCLNATRRWRRVRATRR